MRLAAMKGLSAGEKRDIFYGTAARVYKLVLPSLDGGKL
jgi:hypothetical protein